jgi:hypothetical protein
MKDPNQSPRAISEKPTLPKYPAGTPIELATVDPQGVQVDVEANYTGAKPGQRVSVQCLGQSKELVGPTTYQGSKISLYVPRAFFEREADAGTRVVLFSFAVANADGSAFGESAAVEAALVAEPKVMTETFESVRLGPIGLQGLETDFMYIYKTDPHQRDTVAIQSNYEVPPHISGHMLFANSDYGILELAFKRNCSKITFGLSGLPVSVKAVRFPDTVVDEVEISQSAPDWITLDGKGGYFDRLHFVRVPNIPLAVYVDNVTMTLA